MITCQNLCHFHSLAWSFLYPLIGLTLFSLTYGAIAQEFISETLLEMSLEELMQVEITTAAKTTEKVSEVPASVVVITRQDIEKYGYRTLTEILENIPGLYGIDQYYREGTAFGVRGFWSNWTNKQIVMLVDGARQNYPVRGNYPLTTVAVPVEIIERIEVIRGPMSVIYGDGAFFGAINIITDTSNMEEATNLVSASIGALGTNKVVAKLAGQSGNSDFHYTLNASRYKTDGLDVPYSSLATANLLNSVGVPTGLTTADKLGSEEKYVSFIGKYKDFSGLISYVDDEQGSTFLLPMLQTGRINFAKATTIMVNYEQEWSDRLSLQAHFTYRSYRFFSDGKGMATLSGTPATEEGRADYYEVELNSVYTPSPQLKVVSGLNYRAFPKLSRPTNVPKFGIDNLTASLEDPINSVGLFSQATYKWSDQLSVVAGIRLDYLNNYNITQTVGTAANRYELHRSYDNGGIEWVPRLAILYQPNQQHSFKFLYGEAISWPAFEQNAINSANLKNYPTDSLEPETLRTFELVHTFTSSATWGSQVSVFHNTLDNLIVRDVKLVQDKYLTIQNNSGAMKTDGIETTLHWHPANDWNVELSGTYQHTEDQKFGTAAAYSPHWLGYAKISYQIKPNMMVALTSNYVDEMESLINPQTGKRLGEKVDDYLTLGMNFRIENLLTKGAFLDLRGTNLLDEEIRYPTFTNNSWATYGTVGEGRMWLLSVGLKF